MKFLDNLKIILDFFIAASLGRLALAVIILLAALSLRRPFTNTIIKLLRKMTAKTKNTFDDNIVNAAERPSRFVLGVIGLWLAAKVLKLSPEASGFVNHVVRSCIAFSVFWAAYGMSDSLSLLLSRLKDKTETKLDDILLPFVSKTIKVLVVILGATVIIQEWGYDITGLIAGLGLGGLALALAAQDLAANLFGSITLMLERPFSIGDWILTPHVEGTVEEIGIRSTKVRTFAQALVTVPNSTMSNSAITNWSRMGKRRITFKLGLARSTTSKQMEECIERLRNMLNNHPGIHPQTIFVYFESFGESSLDIFLYFFTKTIVWQEYLEVQEDVNLKILKIIDEMGLSLAYPGRSLYIEQSGGRPEKNGEKPPAAN